MGTVEGYVLVGLGVYFVCITASFVAFYFHVESESLVRFRCRIRRGWELRVARWER